jgi:hypothetical protein
MYGRQTSGTVGRKSARRLAGLGRFHSDIRESGARLKADGRKLPAIAPANGM